MYGQIHLCIRSLVLAKFGGEKWKEILAHSGRDESSDFLTFHYYPDETTVGLIVSVKEVLDVPLALVLELFGEYFFIYCYQNGYDKMLRTLGDNFKTFIQNLDSLHALLSYSYKDIKAPSFRVEDAGDSELALHYYSSRKGLHHIVVGLCRSVGREMFNLEVSLEVIDISEIVLGCNSIVHHVAFRVTCTERVNDAGQELHIDLSGTGSKRKDTGHLRYCVPEAPLISPIVFCQIFPYHVLFDQNLRIKQCGSGILRWTASETVDNMRVDELFVLVKPEIPLTYLNIKRFRNANYVLEHRDEQGKVLIKLRGEMVVIAENEHVLFVGSPRLASLNEMEEMNMFLSDIPLYDVTRELVLLNQQRLAEVEVSKKLDETTAELKRTGHALNEEKKKTEFLLYQMLPKKVAVSLKEGKRVDAEKFVVCTILFSDIVTFTNIAAAVAPIQIVSMLNILYTKFDNLTEKHNVYKVETIGDAYMIVGGVPEPTDTHASNVADFSLDMVARAREVRSPATGKPIQIRVGFHSGPVVAGVVGDKMPRYCLFGDTVNTSSRMESHGLPGKIHMSPTAYGHLKDTSTYIIDSRGAIDVKGKGNMVTYWLRGLADRSKWNLEYDQNGDVIKESQPRSCSFLASPQKPGVTSAKCGKYSSEDSKVNLLTDVNNSHTCHIL